jgi:carbohydrate-selective porin OprB
MHTTAFGYLSSGFSKSFAMICSRSESVRCLPTRNSINRQPQTCLSTAASGTFQQLALEQTYRFIQLAAWGLESIIVQAAPSPRARPYSTPTPGTQNLDDKHGTRFHWNPNTGLIFIAEGVYQVNPTTANRGLVGAYTLGGYYDSRQYTGDLVRPAHGANGGLYAIVDQIVYRAEPYVDEKSSKRGLSTFLSCAVAPSDRNLVSLYRDAGCNYVGLVPCRENDIVGLAVGYIKIGDEMIRKASMVHSGHEAVIEASYRIQINDHLYLQPDVQCILHPGAFGEHPNALVSGLRFDITF